MNPVPFCSAASRRRFALACAASVALAAPLCRAADARPTPEAFFQNPSMTGAQLSPDGKTIAVLLAATPKERVRLVTLDAQTLKPTVLAQYASDDVEWFGWMNDHRLVYSLDDRQVALGELNSASGLFAVNTDGSYYRQLVNRYRSDFVHGTPLHEMLPWYTRYVGPAATKHDEEEIFVGDPQRRDDSGASDLRLHRVNTITHRSKDIETPPGAEDWVIDPDGEPRVTCTLAKNRETIWLRSLATGQWSAVAEFDVYAAADAIEPLFMADADHLFVTAHQGHDTRALYTLDMATGKLSGQPVLKSERYDIAPDFITHDGKLIGIRYEVDAEVTKWLAPDMAAMQARLDELLPATINRISVPERGDGSRVTVFAYSDRDPGTYYLYDLPSGKLVRLGARHPEVDAERMSVLEPVHYVARDGLQVPAWLTVPKGMERRNLPLVVLVHGGPWVRGGHYRWDPEVQFLAARGYAVLQPEFRGSTGYGAKLFQAGWKQWGLAMQDDVADGVRWAVAQGLVDPKRVCIAGASYGGYAVLMGLVNDPGIYRCGIDWVGVTDIDLMYTASWSDLTTLFRDYGMPKMVGDPIADAAQLKATSPLRNVDKIHAPLLMAYGGKDKRVPTVHGETFRDQLLKQPGADLEWVMYDQEGHGWRSVETRVDFWNRAAAFLDKHDGPR